MKICVMDIGSNSVRMLLMSDNKPIKKIVETTRLAKNLKDEMLDSQSMERTVKALSFFSERVKREKADKVFAFATAAVRQAKNGQDFIKAVKDECGIDVEIISGEYEAEIGLLGALTGKDGGVIDIGGASSEVAVLKDGKIAYKKSIPMGAVNLTDRYGQDYDGIEKYVKEAVKEYSDKNACGFYGIGGTITNIASILQEMEEYDSGRITGYEIEYKDVIGLIENIKKKTLEERKEIKGLDIKRVEIIHSGIIILKGIMERMGLNKITASDSDNLEGYLIKKGLLK